MPLTGANLVVSDQYNNRVIEITRAGQIVWTFGDGSSTPGPTSVVAPNDVERLPDGTTLIAGSGMSTVPACPTTCPDNRVLLVDKAGSIVWQYGKDGGVSGSGANELDTPVDATTLPNDDVLIVDQGNNRVIEVKREDADGGATTLGGTIVWQYGDADGVAGTGANRLDSPNSAQRLDNGNTLIADEENNRVIEVTPDLTIAWQYPDSGAGGAGGGGGASSSTGSIDYAAFASRLANGNTLVVSSNDGQVYEVTPDHGIAWKYDCTTHPGNARSAEPTGAIRLVNGDTIITDENNNLVYEVNAAGAVVFTYGSGVAGNAAGQLNGPYDAKVVGDFTGLTLPE